MSTLVSRRSVHSPSNRNAPVDGSKICQPRTQGASSSKRRRMAPPSIPAATARNIAIYVAAIVPASRRPCRLVLVANRSRQECRLAARNGGPTGRLSRLSIQPAGIAILRGSRSCGRRRRCRRHDSPGEECSGSADAPPSASSGLGSSRNGPVSSSTTSKPEISSSALISFGEYSRA